MPTAVLTQKVKNCSYGLIAKHGSIGLFEFILMSDISDANWLQLMKSSYHVRMLL